MEISNGNICVRNVNCFSNKFRISLFVFILIFAKKSNTCAFSDFDEMLMKKSFELALYVCLLLLFMTIDNFTAGFHTN